MYRQMKLQFPAHLWDKAHEQLRDMYDVVAAVSDYYLTPNHINGEVLLVWVEGEHDPKTICDAFRERIGPCNLVWDDIPHVPDGLSAEHDTAMHEAAERFVQRERRGLVTDEEREHFEMLQAHAIEHGEAAVVEFIEKLLRDIGITPGGDL